MDRSSNPKANPTFIEIVGFFVGALMFLFGLTVMITVKNASSWLPYLFPLALCFCGTGSMVAFTTRWHERAYPAVSNKDDK